MAEQTQYRYPRRHTPRPTPGTLEELTDEQLELYEIPDQRGRLLAATGTLAEAVRVGAEIAPYVTEIVDERDRLDSLQAEYGRRLEDRLDRMVQR